MPQEIERKFLVKNSAFKKESIKVRTIKQGFLNSDKNRVVRIRIQNNIAFITVKGLTSKDGTTRFEWEKEINLVEAENLLLLCEPTIIYKERYMIPCEKHTYEVDVFQNENNGLILAEIELSSADEKFIKPDWLGAEVTGEKKYYNSNLSKYPFKNWK